MLFAFRYCGYKLCKVSNVNCQLQVKKVEMLNCGVASFFLNICYLYPLKVKVLKFCLPIGHVFLSIEKVSIYHLKLKVQSSL